MPYEPNTNFKDSNNVDLGKKLVTKDYLLSVYGSILDNVPNTGLTVTPALWVWGRNIYGELGINNALNRSTPVTTVLGGTNWKQVSSGGSVAAIKTDGTLWVWGLNSYGQLGINDTINRSTPVTTFAGGTNWKTVSTGGLTFCTAAIKTDGSLWVWGRNIYGELGINNTLNRRTPVTTFAGGNDWKSIACGGFGSSLAIKTDGTLWVWGRNYYGNLGINNTINRRTPVTTFAGGTNWKQVACASESTSAIKTDGTLWTWGSNNTGQLGINAQLDRITPVTTFLGGTNWKSLATGGYWHTAAIKTDGTLWTWGYNYTAGQLGINNTINRSTPVTTFLGGTNWKSVACGDYHTAAIKTDGTLWVWGRNYHGQLGINNTINRSTPVTTILGGTNWKSVACGPENIITILSTDTI